MGAAVVVIAQAGGQSAFDRFLGAVIGGLSLGAIYALLALGFVIIFKATQVLNFAHERFRPLAPTWSCTSQSSSIFLADISRHFLSGLSGLFLHPRGSWSPRLWV